MVAWYVAGMYVSVLERVCHALREKTSAAACWPGSGWRACRREQRTADSG